MLSNLKRPREDICRATVSRCPRRWEINGVRQRSVPILFVSTTKLSDASSCRCKLVVTISSSGNRFSILKQARGIWRRRRIKFHHLWLTRRSSVRNRSGAASWLEANVCKVAVAYAMVAGRESVVMANEEKTKLRLEIAHVLFIDIVGYSKLLITEQSEQLRTLREIVRQTEQFRLAEAEGKLLRFPTGDGGALVFRTNPEAPVLCALEINKALKDHPELRVRMGIHSGPVNEVTDLNEQANIAGAGINIAQRVMDGGAAGHILLSRHVADDLEHYPHWQPCLHNLGEFEVKHGARIGIVNLYDDQIGNPQLPKKFQALKKHRGHVRWAEATIALFVLATVAAAFFYVLRKPTRALLGIAEKSIAVLPFENLSEDKANAYFAEGIQDEILTRLSKIADLKVISRTSTQQYQSRPGNLSEIA